MVDVIICVHNAYDDVKRCIESVDRHTDIPYRLIVVDDGSEALTRDYLIGIKSLFQDMILLRNEEGHGYTYAVNMGIDASNAEYVVLLNSDTIVSKGWLNKLVSPLINDDELGLTGPLANVASWQSIPILSGANGDWYYNEIPKELTVDELAAMVESNLDKGLVFVPLLNGFCLAVKRKVFEAIGKFDLEHFPRGYGEEDDFNIRAGNIGFKLAVVTNCYIYHAQSKSYSNAKRLELCKRSGEVLKKLHGEALLNKYVDMMRFNPDLVEIRRKAKKMLGMDIHQGQDILPNEVIEILQGVDDIYMYGAGRYAKKYTQIFMEEGFGVNGYIVSSLDDNPSELLGKKVGTIEMIDDKRGKGRIAIFVAVKNDGESIKKSLIEKGYSNVYVLG